MSLSSLRSLTGAASFASNALDTARSTFKAMADAAVPPAGSDAAGTTPGERRPSGATPGERRPSAPAGEVSRVADPAPTEKRKAGMRKGIALDAYA